MTYEQQRAHARARATLSHYLRTAYETAGLSWNADNESEIAGIVDDLIFAATPPENLPQ